MAGASDAPAAAQLSEQMRQLRHKFAVLEQARRLYEEVDNTRDWDEPALSAAQASRASARAACRGALDAAESGLARCKAILENGAASLTATSLPLQLLGSAH